MVKHRREKEEKHFQKCSKKDNPKFKNVYEYKNKGYLKTKTKGVEETISKSILCKNKICPRCSGNKLILGIKKRESNPLNNLQNSIKFSKAEETVSTNFRLGHSFTMNSRTNDKPSTYWSNNYEFRIPNVANPFGNKNIPIQHDAQMKENSRYLKLLQNDIQNQIDIFNNDIVNQQPISQNDIESNITTPLSLPGGGVRKI